MQQIEILCENCNTQYSLIIDEFQSDPEYCPFCADVLVVDE